jgi:integral membrane protein
MSDDVSTRPRRATRPVGPPLRRYRVMANVTGVMLLLLVAEVIVKYGFLGGRNWAGDLVAIAHGWIYVVYLFTVVDLWTTLRWRFGRLLALVLAGVVPGLSFVVERRVVREVQGTTAAERGRR